MHNLNMDGFFEALKSKADGIMSSGGGDYLNNAPMLELLRREEHRLTMQAELEAYHRLILAQMAEDWDNAHPHPELPSRRYL